MAEDKAPFEQLVSSMSSTILEQRIGIQRQGQKFTFDSAAKKLRSLLKSELQCELNKLGPCLGLSPARVEDLMAAAEGDREKQIDYVLLAWVEENVEKATVEEALRGLYAADDTHTVEIVAKELSDSGSTIQRDVMIPKKPSYADSVVMPLPPTQAHFLTGGGEVKLAESFSRMTVIPHTSPKRLQSESDVGTPVELPPEVSLQAPHEETDQPNNMFHPQEPSSAKEDESDSKIAEASIAMEETWPRVPQPVTTIAAVVSSSYTTPQMATQVNATAFQEKHEMVSGDNKMERMQSNLDDLLKSLQRIELGLEDVKSDHQKESVYVRKRTDELDSKLKKLEEENEQLRKNVIDLQNELKETKIKLQEALEEAARLRQNNKDLTNQIKEERAKFREEREEMRRENDAMQERAATSERHRAEMQESLERQASEWKIQQGHYERELREMKEELALVKKTIEEYTDKNSTDNPSDTLRQHLGGETGVWEWKEKLGSGGFGDVFLAVRRGSEELFAAKRITLNDRDSIEYQEEMATTFIKEIKALKECDHRYLVKYVDRYVETTGSSICFYIIMEYMAQGSLSGVIKKEGKLDELAVKRYTGQLLDGLSYLHKRDIIHRDIKCSNILLDERGDIKLADFGCVKFMKRKVSSGIKMTGTAWWMAPELANQSAEASEKSDVWSVGATVVEMLTGKRPFSEYEEKVTVIFALGGKSISLDKLIRGPGFSDEVQEFLRLCITWEPNNRATVKKLMGTPFVCS